MGKTKSSHTERPRRAATYADGIERAESPTAELPIDETLAYLAETPDIGRFLAAHPSQTIDDLRRTLAQASELLHGARTVYRRKGSSKVELARTHGLPEPDGMLHKGKVFRALLAPLKPGRMLDLGAGKGNYSLSAAEAGWQVTAVDARTVRWPNPDTLDDPHLAELIRSVRWVQADVREFPIAPDDYDLICILGLLHHLELPDQVDLITRCGGTLLVIDTRIAPAIVDRDGDYEGIVVREHGDTREERDGVPTASWGNATSFRHTEESLVRLLRNCGYPQVLLMRPPHRRDYTFYVALPRGKGDEDGPSWRDRKKKTIGRDRESDLWPQLSGILPPAPQPSAANDEERARA